MYFLDGYRAVQSSAEFALSLWKYLRIDWEIKSCQEQNKENQFLAVLHFCHFHEMYTISWYDPIWHIKKILRNLSSLNADWAKESQLSKPRSAAEENRKRVKDEELFSLENQKLSDDTSLRLNFNCTRLQARKVKEWYDPDLPNLQFTKGKEKYDPDCEGDNSNLKF